MQFAEAFPGVRRILELGSLEGGHTFALGALAGVDEVVAIEGRTENVERARVVQRALGVDNVKFVVGNLETMDLAPLGHSTQFLYRAAVSPSPPMGTACAARRGLRAGVRVDAMRR